MQAVHVALENHLAYKIAIILVFLEALSFHDITNKLKIKKNGDYNYR